MKTGNTRTRIPAVKALTTDWKNTIRNSNLHCLFPNFDDWVTVCSNTIELEKTNLGHKIDYGTLRDKSEVTAPDYASRVQSFICAPNPDFSHFREYLESIKK